MVPVMQVDAVVVKPRSPRTFGDVVNGSFLKLLGGQVALERVHGGPAVLHIRFRVYPEMLDLVLGELVLLAQGLEHAPHGAGELELAAHVHGGKTRIPRLLICQLQQPVGPPFRRGQSLAGALSR